MDPKLQKLNNKYRKLMVKASAAMSRKEALPIIHKATKLAEKIHQYEHAIYPRYGVSE